MQSKEKLVSLWDLYKKQFPEPPTDDSLTNSAIEIIVFSVDIADRICRNVISESELIESLQRIRNSQAYKFESRGPISLSLYKDVIPQIRLNVEHLLRSRTRTKSAYDTAIDDSFRRDPNPVNGFKLEVLRYYANQPLATLSKASVDLNRHTSSVSRALHELRTKHHLQFYSATDRWAFGIETLMLSFKPFDSVSWKDIRDPMIRFPFFYKLSEDELNGHHYLSFIFPRIPRLIREFQKSIGDYADRYFDAWTLHEGISAYIDVNFDELSKVELSLPSIIDSVSIPTVIPIDVKNKDKKTVPVKCLTLRDLYVSTELSQNCRRSPKSIANLLKKSYNICMTPNEAYYRKRKLHQNDVIHEYLSWKRHYPGIVLRMEVLCNSSEREIILASLRECGLVAYFISKQGIIFWLDVPLMHIEKYLHYYRVLTKTLGATSIRSCISKYWTGGRGISEMVETWNYFGTNGKRNANLEISPNIFDYI